MQPVQPFTGDDAIDVPDFPRHLRDEAECGGITPQQADAFFDRKRYPEAMAFCARCPVRAACGAWALENAARLPVGVYGGMDENHRAARLHIPKQRARSASSPPAPTCPSCQKRDTVVAYASSWWTCSRCDVRWPSSA